MTSSSSTEALIPLKCSFSNLISAASTVRDGMLGDGMWVQGAVGVDSPVGGGGLTMCVGDVLSNFFFLQRALGMLVTHGWLESGTGDFKGTSTSQQHLFCPLLLFNWKT
jgi:hypothetical protein